MAARCPKCGGQLYGDEDGLACLCGYRGSGPEKIKPGPGPVRSYQGDGVGWWAAMGVPHAEIRRTAERGIELSSLFIQASGKQGFNSAELYIGLKLAMVKAEERSAINLSSSQERSLLGFLQHLAESDCR